MLLLTEEEWERHGTQDAQVIDDHISLNSSQFVMSSEGVTEDAQVVDNEIAPMSSQFVMTSAKGETNSRKNRGKAYLPYAFTEHGVSMLASVLKSEKAVRMSIAIVRAFIALKEFVSKQNAIDAQFQVIRSRLDWSGRLEGWVTNDGCGGGVNQLVAAAVVASADGRTMSVVLPVRQLSGSWLRTRDMAWYNSGSSWRKLTELSKKTSTATAQNSW